MTILYRVDPTTVTPVECEKPKWPHPDADGKYITPTTHFKCEADAWHHLLGHAEATMNNALDRVLGLQQELDQAERFALRKAVEYKAAKIGFAAWQEKQHAPD